MLLRQLFHTLRPRRNPFSISLFPRFVSNTSEGHRFAVSYLINKFGLCRKSALRVSKHLQFDTPDKPDSVVALFESQGFSNTQTKRIIKRLPSLLLCDPEKTLLPKLEFLGSKGFSKPQVAEICYYNPEILRTSLEKQIIPSFDVLGNLLESKKKHVEATRLSPRVISIICRPFFLVNVNVLREIGVPDWNVAHLLHFRYWTFVISPDRLKEIVERLYRMKFYPSTRAFVFAVHALASMNESSWRRKIDVFKQWGLSEEEVLKVFRSCPWCMTKSEDKIMAVMEFLVNKMSLHPSAIAKTPIVLNLSLERRIVPRGLFAQDLLSRGLIIGNLSLPNLFYSSEENFLQRFVNCHEEKAAELLELYQSKLDLSRKLVNDQKEGKYAFVKSLRS